MLHENVISLQDWVLGCPCNISPRVCLAGPRSHISLPHRFQDPTEWVAYAGTNLLSGSEASTVRARVARVIAHPFYNPDTADFDVAVVQLGSPLPFGRSVQPVCLPAAAHVFPPRRRCLISGWGHLKEDFRKSGLPAGVWLARNRQAGRPHPPRIPRLRFRVRTLAAV